MLLLQQLGIEYTKTHNIQYLVERVPGEQGIVDQSLLDEVYYKAHVLFDWEAKTRYAGDYLVQRRLVNSNILLAEKLLNALMSYAEQNAGLRPKGDVASIIGELHLS